MSYITGGYGEGTLWSSQFESSGWAGRLDSVDHFFRRLRIALFIIGLVTTVLLLIIGAPKAKESFSRWQLARQRSNNW